MSERKLESSDLEKIASIPYCSLKVDLKIGLAFNSNIEICHSSGTYIRSKIINYLKNEVNKKQFNYLKKNNSLVRFIKYLSCDLNPFDYLHKTLKEKKWVHTLFLTTLKHMSSLFQPFLYKAKALNHNQLFTSTLSQTKATIKYTKDKITIEDKDSIIGLEILLDFNIDDHDSLDEVLNHRTKSRCHKNRNTPETDNHIKSFKKLKEPAEVGLYMFKHMWKRGTYFVTEKEFNKFKENYQGITIDNFSLNVDITKELHRLELRNSLLDIFDTLDFKNNIINSIDSISNNLQEVIEYSEKIKLPTEYNTFIKGKIILYRASLEHFQQKLKKARNQYKKNKKKNTFSNDETKNKISKFEQKIIIHKALEKSLSLGMGLEGFKTGITENYDVIQELRSYSKNNDDSIPRDNEYNNKYIKDYIKELKKKIKKERKDLNIEHSANSKVLSYIKTGESDSISFLQSHFGKTILYYNGTNNDLITRLQENGIFKCVVISDKHSTKNSLYRNQHSPLSIINLAKE